MVGSGMPLPFGSRHCRQVCQSYQYPGENPLSILVGKLFGVARPPEELLSKQPAYYWD